MQIRTKFYGEVNGNARHDCPFCLETRGRFYINITKTRKNGLWLCHNCGRKGRIEKHSTIEFFTDEEYDSREPEISLVEYKAVKNDEALFFLESRGIRTQHKSFYVTTKKVVNFTEKTPCEYRLLLPAKSLVKDKKFYNLRAIYPGIVPKVLFPSSKHKNIAKKSHAVLWNPEVAFLQKNRIKDIIPVVCEGDMGAWSVWHETEESIYIGVAVFGKFISTAQAYYLSNFKAVYIMPDMDQSDLEIEQNYRKMLFAGAEDVRVYDKSQYTGPKDDANDLLKLDRNFFEPSLFKKLKIF